MSYVIDDTPNIKTVQSDGEYEDITNNVIPENDNKFGPVT
jgi:hypothetical protein